MTGHALSPARRLAHAETARRNREALDLLMGSAPVPGELPVIVGVDLGAFEREVDEAMRKKMGELERMFGGTWAINWRDFDRYLPR